MTIKELEQLVGLPRASIRFYEQEGFLSPRRLKNNYRDYSPQDARTLGKIKLLRQLHLDLDSIRRLEAGELTLTQALEDQLSALGQDRAALDRADEVCRSLLRAGTGYAELDPGPWLEELERIPAPSGPHLANPSDTLDLPGPWRRFFARWLDSLLYALPWLAIQLFLLHDYQSADPVNPVVYYVAFLVPWVFLMLFLGPAIARVLIAAVLEPAFLHLLGATPGKWIMGLEVRNTDGSFLTWEQAGARTMGVVFRGEGLYLPLISLWRNYRSYCACKDGQVLPWDEGLSYTQRSRGLVWRIPALLVGFALCFAAQHLLLNVSYQLPHPDGLSSSADLVENYNAFAFRRTPGAPREVLSQEDGRWVFDVDTAWTYEEVEFWSEGEAPRVSYTARLDPGALDPDRYSPPYDLNSVVEENLILALSCAARPWPVLSSKEEVKQLEQELESLWSVPLTPPVTELDRILSCGVRIQVQADAPGYVSIDGTAAELIWAGQPDPAQPIAVRVTLSLG